MVWLETGRVPMPWHRTLVAYASDHLPRAGAFKSCVAMLHERELIGYRGGGIADPDGPIGLVLEHLGRGLADAPVGPFTREAYWEKIDGKLGPVERLICKALRELVGGAVARDELAHAIGRESVRARREFRNALARLLGVDLIQVEGGCYSATLNLCPLSIFELRELRS
jgi:hypothetical protein